MLEGALSVMRMSFLFAFAFAFAFFSSTVFSATSTTTFTVSATVSSNCLITANNLTFGMYNPVQASDLDATVDLEATCTNGLPYTVGLSAGGGSGATVSDRKMTGNSTVLNYSLFLDSGRTTNWDNIGGSNIKSLTGDGSAQTITVYGRIPQLQLVPAGVYSDTITVTISY